MEADDLTFWEWVLDNWTFCAFVLALFVQFTPIIKFNPFTALFKWVGNVMTKNLEMELGDLRTCLDKHIEDDDINQIDNIRNVVLDFANSCRNGRRHSKNEFEHIIDLNSKYESLLRKYNLTNGVFAEDYKYVLSIYNDNLSKNSFLA